jgi:hypothetical protein
MERFNNKNKTTTELSMIALFLNLDLTYFTVPSTKINIRSVAAASAFFGSLLATKVSH